MTARHIRQSVFSASILLHLLLLVPFIFITRSKPESRQTSISLMLQQASSPQQAAQPLSEQPVLPQPKPVAVQPKPAPEPQRTPPEPATTISSSQGAPPQCARQESAAETVSTGPPQPTPAPQSGEYLAMLKARIEAEKHYPSFARKLLQEGTVVINITIGTDGGLIASELVRSSGYSTLDKAALKAVRKATPFPPPSSYGLGRMSIDVPLVFKLI